jgi:hypothetical protein
VMTHHLFSESEESKLISCKKINEVDEIYRLKFNFLFMLCTSPTTFLIEIFGAIGNF